MQFSVGFGHRVFAGVFFARCGFIAADLLAACVNGNSRNKNVVADISFQYAGRVTHPVRHAGVVIDTNIELAAFERAIVVRFAVSRQFLNGNRPFLWSAATIK